MTKLIRTVHIDTPPEKVWAILADFGGVARYNPGVPTSRSTSEAAGGVGATRHCDLAPVGSVEERILDWREGEGYRLEIYDSEKVPPFARSEAELSIAADGEGTRFTGTLEYALKFGPIGSLIDRLVARRQFDKAWTRFAAGLKHHAETGEPIDGPAGIPVDAVTVG